MLLHEGQRSERTGALAHKGALDTRQSLNVTESNRETPSEHSECHLGGDRALACSSFSTETVKALAHSTEPAPTPPLSTANKVTKSFS